MNLTADALYRDLRDRRLLRDAIDRNGSVKGSPVAHVAKDGRIFDSLVTSSVRREGTDVAGYPRLIRDVTHGRRFTQSIQSALQRTNAAPGQLVEMLGSYTARTRSGA